MPLSKEQACDLLRVYGETLEQIHVIVSSKNRNDKDTWFFEVLRTALKDIAEDKNRIPT